MTLPNCLELLASYIDYEKALRTDGIRREDVERTLSKIASKLEGDTFYGISEEELKRLLFEDVWFRTEKDEIIKSSFTQVSLTHGDGELDYMIMVSSQMPKVQMAFSLSDINVRFSNDRERLRPMSDIIDLAERECDGDFVGITLNQYGEMIVISRSGDVPHQKRLFDFEKEYQNEVYRLR